MIKGYSKPNKHEFKEAVMKKLGLILALAILLAGGMLGVMSISSGAQERVVTTYQYPPPPLNPLEHPWVGPKSPWVYYHGDWFLKGELYYYYGPKLGWAPYFSFDPSYIKRPAEWYDPRWNAWYEQHPQYWAKFQAAYPWWTEHRMGTAYEEEFYRKHHPGESRWRRAWRELRRGDKD
jgi:hypothetical protein